MTKRSYAWLCVAVMLGCFGALHERVTAQTTRQTASMSVRRLATLTSRVVPGDFNGDGFVDLAATAVGTRSISVALGKGDGTFNAPLSTGVAGGVLAAGDFNRDGKLDLIADVDATDMPLRVLLGNGDGSFQPPAQIGGAVVAELTFALVADFDGDHNDDVAVGYRGTADDGGVLIYQGRGDGTFTDLIARLDTGVNSGPLGGVAADLDGDGRADVVVANHIAKSISIFVNHGAFNFTASDKQMSSPANDVAAADVNGDGKIDVIVAESTSADGDVSFADGSVWVYLGNGDGTLAQFGHVYTTGHGAWRVVTGDFNRDGFLDIATANRSAIAIHDCGPLYKTWDSISILNGNGNGTFATDSTNFSIGNQQSLDDPRYRHTVRSLATTDVNADGVPDLIVSEGVVFTNNPPDPNWAPAVTAGPDQTITGTHSVTLRAVAEDVDQDALQYVWDSNTGQQIPQVPNPCITVAGGGTFTFTVTVFDMQGHQASATVHYTFEGDPNPPPQIRITAPAPGEVVPAGRPYTIKWIASFGTVPVASVSVLYSSDGMNNWAAPAGCENLAPTATSCVWTNPNPPTENGVLALNGTSTQGGSGSNETYPVIVRAGNTAGLPGSWLHADVGSVGASGSATDDGNQWDGRAFAVTASGADIWGTADAFHFAWTSFSGDFEIEARVNSVDAVNAWTKAGLMIRENPTDASSRHASLFATPGKGIAFQRRPATGGTSVNTAVAAVVAPVWLRMTRVGDTITAYYRKNRTTMWTTIGSQTLAALPATVAVGLAVTSHADPTLATAKFAGVWVARLQSWTDSPIGTASGGFTTDRTTFTVNGSGADIWGASDAFNYMWVRVSDVATITVRVQSVDNTHAWAKAGLMIRESLAADARQVDAFVTPGKGIAMQYRSTTGGTSASAANVAGAAPAWLRLQRGPGVGGATDGYTAWYSTDGQIWRVLGSVNFNMTHTAPVYIGVAVTSHNTGAMAASVIDSVRVEP